MTEADTLADRVGIIDRGKLLSLKTPDALKRHYGTATLEEAFFAATGRTFADDSDEDEDGEDNEREVLA
jgi:ABC-2 type transport system ATP-binding protein